MTCSWAGDERCEPGECSWSGAERCDVDPAAERAKAEREARGPQTTERRTVAR